MTEKRLCVVVVVSGQQSLCCSCRWSTRSNRSFCVVPFSTVSSLSSTRTNSANHRSSRHCCHLQPKVTALVAQQLLKRFRILQSLLQLQQQLVLQLLFKLQLLLQLLLKLQLQVELYYNYCYNFC